MKIVTCVPLLLTIHAVLAQFGQMEEEENIVLGHNSTPPSSPPYLEKRGYHEELPLIYVADDDHPSDHYWTRPYFPTR